MSVLTIVEKAGYDTHVAVTNGDPHGSVTAARVLTALAAASASVDVNAQKIVDIANGTAATDAAAFGQVPVVSDVTPSPPGTPAIGSNAKYAKADHVHADGFTFVWNFTAFPGTVVARYVQQGSGNSLTATHELAQATLGRDFVVQGMRVTFAVANGTDGCTITLTDAPNGGGSTPADTTVTVSMTSAETDKSDVAHTPTIAGGRRIAPKFVSGGTTTVAVRGSIAVWGYYV